MSEFFEIMTAPFVVCLVLTGMHAYLGLHIIKRGVIFVDLALAQVAAFGATVGFLWGFKLHSTESYLLSLLFTIIGAAIFAFSRYREEKVPQEAFIGIIYAVFAAAAVLVLSRAADGGEELKAVMVGHLLFVDWDEIVKIAVLYSLIGVVHWFLRKPFFAISTDAEAAFAKGMKVRSWDFIFYVTFGAVVTSSTEVAGVLVVFSLLVVPAVCAALLAESNTKRLVIGWGVGALASAVGVALSYVVDLPTGATVVCVLGAALLCVVALNFIRANKSMGRVLGN